MTTSYSSTDKSAPMPSAPMKYLEDGRVDWGTMWDTFCAPAWDGGPPHRGTMLYAAVPADSTSAQYQAVVAELIRGITAVSGLPAAPAEPGWIAVACASPAMAQWLGESIVLENVAARWDAATLLLPAGPHYTLGGEIKNVITVIAKSHHYWIEHLPTDVKRTLAVQNWLAQMGERVQGWLRPHATRS
ncbi:MAG: hypothetical protein HC876_06100 [Chloroflexaceae bacterium]|nr:hypothetical protein [Chloroflexaceae bacterium]NJO05114.1 hypothetical protein [Chloroflexaceae bacterium]